MKWINRNDWIDWSKPQNWTTKSHHHQTLDHPKRFCLVHKYFFFEASNVRMGFRIVNHCLQFELKFRALFCQHWHHYTKSNHIKMSAYHLYHWFLIISCSKLCIYIHRYEVLCPIQLLDVHHHWKWEKKNVFNLLFKWMKWEINAYFLYRKYLILERSI